MSYNQGSQNASLDQQNPTPWQTGQQGNVAGGGQAQRFEPSARPGDDNLGAPNWETQPSSMHPDNSPHAPAGPGDVFASHGGQLGTAGRAGSGGGGFGDMRRDDAMPRQNASDFGGGAQENRSTGTGAKFMGNVEQFAGKVAHNKGMMERGAARKSGVVNEDDTLL